MLCNFNFHQNKNIFTKQIIFLSNLLFSLIKVLHYKIILKTYSRSLIIIDIIKEQFNSQLNLNFFTNNVKGLQSSKKRVKIFEYFRNKVAPKDILFLQETHSSVETEKQWNDKFKGQLYFSHVKTNSCCVLTGFYGNINVVIKKQLNDKNGRILILEVTTDDTEYLLINILQNNTNLKLRKIFLFC